MGRQLKAGRDRSAVKKRTKHYERGCQYIAQRWRDDYAKLPLEDIVRLGNYALPAELKQKTSNEVLDRINQQHKTDFFEEWQAYSKAIKDSSHFPLVVYEGAVRIVANSLPAEKRDIWNFLFRASVSWLKIYHGANDVDEAGADNVGDIHGTNDDGEAGADNIHGTNVYGEAGADNIGDIHGTNDDGEAGADNIHGTNVYGEAGTDNIHGTNDAGDIHGTINTIIVPPVRIALDNNCHLNNFGHSHYSNYGLPSPASHPTIGALIPPTTQPRIFAEIATLAELKTWVSEWIMEGLSATRCEERKKLPDYTNHVRLGLPNPGPADVQLEIDLPASLGEKICEANVRSVEELRSVLGVQLFEAIKCSNRRQGEKGRLSCTNAVRVFFQGSSEVCTLTVDLDFSTGVKIWKAVYRQEVIYN